MIEFWIPNEEAYEAFTDNLNGNGMAWAIQSRSGNARRVGVEISDEQASALLTLHPDVTRWHVQPSPPVLTRRTFLFDVSDVEFEQAGQLYVEQWTNERGETTEIAIAVRTDDRDTWGPPVIGKQTS